MSDDPAAPPAASEGAPADAARPQDANPEQAPLAAGALTDAVGGLLRVLFTRGRTELGRVASTGRVRLDLRQLRKDRDVMYQKLGREVRSLVEGGEVHHPGLARGVERIAEVDARIAGVEQELREAESAASGSSPDPSAAENPDSAPGPAPLPPDAADA